MIPNYMDMMQDIVGSMSIVRISYVQSIAPLNGQLRLSFDSDICEQFRMPMSTTNPSLRKSQPDVQSHSHISSISGLSSSSSNPNAVKFPTSTFSALTKTPVFLAH